MWENGKKLLKYIIQRGGRISQSADGFKITDTTVEGFHGEVGALANTLDMLKQNAEDIHLVCHASQVKKRHSDDSASVETFDPAVSIFLGNTKAWI